MSALIIGKEPNNESIIKNLKDSGFTDIKYEACSENQSLKKIKKEKTDIVVVLTEKMEKFAIKNLCKQVTEQGQCVVVW